MPNKANKIAVLCGPTASSKTSLGVALALACNGEIVSADSMQIYRKMTIGTAKPTKEEQKNIPHHMLDVADPDEDYSVARYVKAATACVDDILSRNKLPIVVGGTGLYIDSLIAGREFASFSGTHREILQTRVQTEGLPALHEELKKIDPDRAARLHTNDEKRILRALEVFYETGLTITEHDTRTKTIPPRYDAAVLGLNFTHRPDLWARIDLRVNLMMQEGLEQEVRALLDDHIPDTCTSMQAIGYKELAAALREGRPLQEAVEEIKLRSRQYAKRQLTWFRRNSAVRWLLMEKIPDLEKLRQLATEFLEESGLP